MGVQLFYTPIRTPRLKTSICFGQVRTDQARSNQARPGQARSGQSSPVQARPGEARPKQVRSGQVIPDKLQYSETSCRVTVN